ncbi:hypothetical protein QTJ04_07295 [Clostridium perfringens]|uniref:hypothetical protein n=1 Tax=Clostridium perfringens TaxID=1502 RepID=UPI0013E3329B|nr:hypothetical protein [Clostridium perfringens]MCX0410605.1 hypothetical protein [Clostridium perfringens]MDM1006059.1 hypothetical protein [Clostridium perfringens]MDU5249430.1 hypothetical protein [Clostridium perfringens]NGT83191.1 hypothetical protein [Clostridium perfringens]BDA33828.1 hypothetical protein CPBEC5_08360 [Clostridium perfringens]
MHSSKKLNLYIVANLIIIGIILVISILMHRISIIFFMNLILIGALNIALLNRVKYSLDLLRKLRKLEDVDFPRFKDISMVLLGVLFSIVTYTSLFLESLGIIDISKILGKDGQTNNILLSIILLIICLWAFIINLSGAIVTESTSKGRKIFDLSENNVALGNEALNRSTGSFKDGIILGYYIFYFKNIQVAYRDKSGNIIVEGYDKSPFKITIAAKRSKKYFSKILDVD